MRQKANSRLLPLVICFLCLPGLTSCVMFAESMITMQWQQGCEGFPSVEEVKQVLAEHSDLVKQIEDVSPGHVSVHLTPCPGGAFITILYGGISEKMEIERVLDAAGAREEGRANVPWEFFGVPYGWVNTSGIIRLTSHDSGCSNVSLTLPNEVSDHVINLQSA